MELVSKRFDELTAREVYEILKARSAVFMMEQRIFYLDMDDIDYDCLHVFYTENGKVIAYLRAYETEENTVRVGRVLTIERGKGLGRSLMEAAIKEICEKMAPKVITIDSQIQAVGFYEKTGFTVCSDEFMEAGVKHKKMELRITPSYSAPIAL